jgi:hypothetical protein
VNFLGGILATALSPSGSATTIPIPSIPNGGSFGVGSSGGVSVGSSSVGLGTSFVGVFLEVIALLFALSLIGVFVIIVIANRADPDPSGRRPQSVYYFIVSFVTLSIAILGSAVIVGGVASLIGHHSHAASNAAARAIVLGALTTLVSVFLLVTHLRRGLALARMDNEPPGPSRRVGQSYVSSVAFVAIVSLLVLFVFIVYLIFALVAPGVFGSLGGQADTGRVIVVALYLWVAAIIVLSTHHNLLSPGLDVFGRPGRSPASTN